jgi:uncharacterized protein (UPF0548 family)
VSSRGRERVDALHALALNFDPARREAEGGWHVDAYCTRLPPEPPGPPLPDASFAAAQDVMRDYEFADPRIVRAVYHPDGPLAGRDMLLELRFLGVRFHAGVRVGGVIDETREVDGRTVSVWGWNYSTLQGHLEKGQMDYEAWKWHDDGTVEFRIRRYSKAAHIANPVIRLGFRLFGRREQVRFAEHALERMRRLVSARLVGRPADVPRVEDEITLAPLSEAPQAQRDGPG